MLLLGVMPGLGFAEFAVWGEPLKKSYSFHGGGYSAFYQTGKVADSYSMKCDMGNAVPDAERKNWYIENPLYGLRLELKAQVAIVGKLKDKPTIPMGFVLIKKNEAVLTQFLPIGHYINSKWEGSIFNVWSGIETDISVIFSGRDGSKGLAHFDLLSGLGFLYKPGNFGGRRPDFFLSNCSKVGETNLPVYDWK